MFDKGDYSEYINSATWKQVRAAAIERAQYRCEVCGMSKWSVKLEVHHKTYDRFKRELPTDLQVLCPDCHKVEDEKRAKRGRVKSQRALNSARLNGWATKVYGEHWEDRYDDDHVAQRFEEWQERKAWND